MPRPRKEPAPLSPGAAQYVLDRLVNDRRVSARDIEGYVRDMQGEIRALEEKLARLRAMTGPTPSAPPVRRGPGRPPRSAAAVPEGWVSSGSPQAAPEAPRRRGRRARKAITPEQLASRKLQGRYLGLIRQIPASRRGQYQRIAKDESREAAIRAMEKALGK